MKQWLTEVFSTLGKENFVPLWIIFIALLFILGIIFESELLIILFVITVFLFPVCRVINANYPNGIPPKIKLHYKDEDDDGEFFTLPQEMRAQIALYRHIIETLGIIYEWRNKSSVYLLIGNTIQKTKEELDANSDIFSLEFSDLAKELLLKLKMQTAGLYFVGEKQFYEYIVKLTDIAKKDFIIKHLLNLPIKKQNEIINILVKHAEFMQKYCN